MREIKKAFADQLQDLLAEVKETRGISLHEVARASGVPSGSISAYQNAEKEAGIEKLSKLADYFEVSTDFLLGRSTDKEGNADVMEVEKRLGLCEGAQTNLMYHPGVSMQLVNFLLCDNDFYRLLACLNGYASADFREDLAKYTITGILSEPDEIDTRLLEHEHQYLNPDTVRKLNLIEATEAITSLARKWKENRTKYVHDKIEFPKKEKRGANNG